MAITERHRSVAITSEIVENLSAGADTPFGCYLVGPGDPLVDEARRLERAVFLETFGNTSEMLDAEYGPYEDASIFGVVIDHVRARVAGVMRLIFDRHGRLKSLADIEAEPWSMSLEEVLDSSGLTGLQTGATMDIATLAVDPEYRSKQSSDLVSFTMYQTCLSLSRFADLDFAVAILDVAVLDLIQTRMGTPMQYYAGVEPKSYLDSPSSLPCYCEFDEYASRCREIDQSLEDALFGGGPAAEGAITAPDYERAAAIIASLTSRPAGVVDLASGIGASTR